MINSEWIYIASEEELPEGVPRTASVEEKEVLVVKLGGRIYACANECPHYGAPLSEGIIRGHTVTCPWHNARFDLTDGRLVSAPALDDLPSYEVKIEGGEVYIRGPKAVPLSPPAGKDDRTFIILGAGAAGNAAAETLRREGYAGRLVLITAESEGPYDRTMLSKDFLSGKAPDKWLPLRGKSFYECLGIELLTDHRVRSLDPSSRRMTFADGAELSGDRILLATGGKPKSLPIPGVDLSGCFRLRSAGDARAIREAARKAERAVILGAGFIGMETAASLTRLGLEVQVAAPEEVAMELPFGREVGRRMQRLHEEQGVRFHLGRTAREIRGDSSVREVILSDGLRLKTDLVIIGVGIEPAVDYLLGTGLVEDGVVPVNGRLETEAEGIFAAGDIASVLDRRTGRPVRVEHWVVAERHGQHAARAMLGSREPYVEPPFFWTKQYDASLKYIGYAPEYDRIVYRGDAAEGPFVAGYYQGDTLLAAAGLGTAGDIILLGELLKGEKAVPPGKLAEQGFDLSELLEP